MSNVSGKAYAMNVVTPMRPRNTWINRLLFMFTRAQPDKLAGLIGLSFIHFARWVIIRREDWPDFGQPKDPLRNDYMLFCSNFNGTWDQYIDAFSDALPSGLDLLWYSSIKYPHSIPITACPLEWNSSAHNPVPTPRSITLWLGFKKQFVISQLKRFTRDFFSNEISNVLKPRSNFICVNNHEVKIIICSRISLSTVR